MFSIVLTFIIVSGACSNDNTEAEESNEKENVNIKVAHVLSTDVTQQEMWEKFQELAEEKSDGRIDIEIFPDAQLGDERELIESVQSGNIQITSPSVGVLENFSDALKVYDFPFIFEDRESVYDVFDGPVGQELLDDLEDSGLIGLAYSENGDGFKHIGNNKREVVAPEDVKGLKIRTLEVPIQQAFWKEMGANPTPMAFSDVYSALSSGTVEGFEVPLQIIQSTKWYEPSKYITTFGYIFDPEPVVINKEFFEDLSEEDQKIIQSSLDEAIEHLRDLDEELDKDLRDELEKEGAEITDLTDEELEVWEDEAIDFYKKYEDEVDKEKLEKLLDAAGNEKILNEIE